MLLILLNACGSWSLVVAVVVIVVVVIVVGREGGVQRKYTRSLKRLMTFC